MNQQDKTKQHQQCAVELQDVKFSYGHTAVLDIDSMRINSGHKVFLHGPSGSGKTTLLGLLAGILTPQSGTITILGTDISGLRPSALDKFRGDHLGYIFQLFNLLPYLSVRENIVLACQLNSVRRQRCEAAFKTMHDGAAYIADHLKLSTFLDKPVHALSVGQQQRVAAARALMGAPEIIIADEPTSALDHDHRELFLELLFREAESYGATIIFVSHDRTLERLFDVVVSLPAINRCLLSPGDF